MNKEVCNYYPEGERPVQNLYLEVNRELAKDIAKFMGLEYFGEFTPENPKDNEFYYIPGKTILDPNLGQDLGIFSENDLFGGVVGYPYLRTKAISHELTSPYATKPEGWSDTFAKSVAEHVLPGYTVFSAEDAISAFQSLRGMRHEVRAKRCTSHSGKWQTVINNETELSNLLKGISPDELSSTGYVLEANLQDIETLSVGQVLINNSVVSYYGIQVFGDRPDKFSTYVGSRLTFTRGDFDELLKRELSDNIRVAIQQAKQFDDATGHLKVIASRRNYDVGQGYDISGNFHSGVLEQSWRIGGATGAEVLALLYLKDNPQENSISASSYIDVEGAIPNEARIYGVRRNGDSSELSVYATLDKS
jgi:hypothetical protein